MRVFLLLHKKCTSLVMQEGQRDKVILMNDTAAGASDGEIDIGYLSRVRWPKKNSELTPWHREPQLMGEVWG